MIKILLCIAPLVHNVTTYNWNSHDDRLRLSAQKTCATRKQYQDTPCLTKFVKVGKQDYHAICGVKQEIISVDSNTKKLILKSK